MAIGKTLKDGDGPLLPPNITSPDEPLSITGAAMGYLKPSVETLMQEPTSSARILAQLLSSPAFLLGAMSTFAAAILADRTQQRGVIMMGLAVVTIAGYCMELFTLNVYGTFYFCNFFLKMLVFFDMMAHENKHAHALLTRLAINSSF